MNFMSYQWFYLAAGLYGGSLLLNLLKRERLSLTFLCSGFVVHTAYLLGRGYHYNVFTSDNMVTGIFCMPWCLALLGIGLEIRGKFSGKALSILFPLCFFTAIALFFPPAISPPDPKHNIIFSTLYFLFEGMAHACFFLGGWFAALYLKGRTEVTSFDGFAIWGFILYSIAQVTGAIWCYLGWSVPFHWSEKHLLSACLWCFYCAYLHLNFSPRWNSRGKAWFAFTGFLVTFLVAYNYFIHLLGGKSV
jgi:hypothetical protein